MTIVSSHINRDELQAQIVAALLIIERPAARDQDEEMYRAGFHTALLAIATANSLNIPQLRNADADARRRNRAISRYDMRL